ncbi:MAG: hypothetical protein M3040_18025 [Bacteroidota bacterium]|nr:hypothetical protein [Bacteroidota bacterium]
MKYVMIIAFGLSTSLVNGQAHSRTHGSRKNTAPAHANKTSVTNDSKPNKSNLPPGTALRGGKIVTLHHGKHDYTPGSPVGTGGAGGNTMSGSQQGSAEENAIGKKAANELLKKNNNTRPDKKKQD